MNKKIIAAAIAASFAAPAMAESNVTVYGKVSQAVQAVDVNSQDEWRVQDQSSRVGFKGSEDLGNGLKALFQIELNLQASTSTDGAQVNGSDPNNTNRNTFVGLAGDFGTVLVGRHDAPHNMAWSKNNPFGDTAGDLKHGGQNAAAATNFSSPIDWERVDGTVAYVSPSFSGLTAAVAIVPLECSGAAGTADCGVNADGLAEVVSGALMYSNAGLYLSAGIMDAPSTMNMDEWNVTAMYSMDAFTVGLTYAEEEITATQDDEAWLLTGTYTMGNNVLKAQWFDVDAGATTRDRDGWALGLDHNFSKLHHSGW